MKDQSFLFFILFELMGDQIMSFFLFFMTFFVHEII